MACDKNHRTAIESSTQNGIAGPTSRYAALAGHKEAVGEVINANHNKRRRLGSGAAWQGSGTAKNGQSALGYLSAPDLYPVTTERLPGGGTPDGSEVDFNGNGAVSNPAGNGTGRGVGTGAGGVGVAAAGGDAGKRKRGVSQHCPNCGRFIGSGMACQACTFKEVLKETGCIDWQAIAACTGVSVAEAQEYLSTIGLAFKDPRLGIWQTADTYLTGNLRAKLYEAEAAAAVNLAYRANVEALRKSQPRPLKPDEIIAPLGAGWIPEEYVAQFARSLGLDVNVDYIPTLGKWIVTPTDHFRKYRWRSDANRKKWGTRYVDAVDLLEQALNGREPTVTRKGKTDFDETYEARDRQRRIKEAFEQWLWTDKQRAERLAGLYNDRFNAAVRPKYDGSYLGDRLPGMSPVKKLRPHQRDAIARLLHSPENTLLAHLTGAGKTMVMSCAAMEMRRLRQRFHIVTIVPNHRPADHARDFQEIYPNAKLLVVTSDDLSADKYAQTMTHIAQCGDQYDTIIMSHAAAERIKIRPETKLDFIKQKLAEYDETLARLPKNAVRKRKELQATRDRTWEKVQQLLEETKNTHDSRLTWEDLGFDQIFLDEAHAFKNLSFATRKQGVAGINPNGSARAMKMFMKVRYVQERCDRCGKYVGPARICPHCAQRIEERKTGNVCFATATPISNSVAECYTWQRLLQPKKLRKLGLEHFDAWSNHFARPISIIELAPFEGGYREATRFASFVNVPELSTILSEILDVQLDPAALNLPLPKAIGGGSKIVSVPMSERLRAYMKHCEERAARIRAREVPPSVDNFLRVANDLTAASLDYRLIDPFAPDDPNSKINVVVREVVEIYKKTTGVSLPGVKERQNLAQVIFLDLSVPKKGFNLYDDIKGKLVAQGIPAEEIAFIHKAKTAEAKQRLFDQVNVGKVRILLASTPLAGEAANFQRLLVALHNVDIPWTALSVIQRKGRIIRQGNLVPNVQTSVYVTRESFDRYRWQTVERKAFAADQLLKGDGTDRTIEDLDVVHADYATIKAMASGNPLVEKRVKLQLELQRYQALERVYHNRREEARHEVDQAMADIAVLEREPDKTAESEPLRAQLLEKIAGYRTTLAEPFEYSATIQRLQQELAQVEKEIEVMNRPERKRSAVGRLWRRFFGGN